MQHRLGCSKRYCTGRSLVLPSTIHIRKSVACEWWNLCTDENRPHVTSSVLSSFFICTLYIAFFRYGGGVLGITKGVMTPYGMYNDKVTDEVSKRKKVHGHKYKLQDDDRLEKIVRKAIIKKIRIWHAMWCLIIYVWQVLSFSKCGYNSIFDLLGFFDLCPLYLSPSNGYLQAYIIAVSGQDVFHNGCASFTIVVSPECLTLSPRLCTSFVQIRSSGGKGADLGCYPF